MNTCNSHKRPQHSWEPESWAWSKLLLRHKLRKRRLSEVLQKELESWRTWQTPCWQPSVSGDAWQVSFVYGCSFLVPDQRESVLRCLICSTDWVHKGKSWTFKAEEFHLILRINQNLIKPIFNHLYSSVLQQLHANQGYEHTKCRCSIVDLLFSHGEEQILVLHLNYRNICKKGNIAE